MWSYDIRNKKVIAQIEKKEYLRKPRKRQEEERMIILSIKKLLQTTQKNNYPLQQVGRGIHRMWYL